MQKSAQPKKFPQGGGKYINPGLLGVCFCGGKTSGLLAVSGSFRVIWGVPLCTTDTEAEYAYLGLQWTQDPGPSTTSPTRPALLLMKGVQKHRGYLV